MKKTLAASASAALLIAPLLVPAFALAHEHGTYVIGKDHYQIVIGSLNEPVAVDDKTGVDLTVTKCKTAACTPSMGPDGDMDGPAGDPVADLDTTLKVELIAGDAKKTLPLSPQYGKDGAYMASFYPTVATTYTYHLIGSIAGTPVDLSYTCLPDGATALNETDQKQISDGVTQLTLAGGFGCPKDKAALGFPEPSITMNDAANDTGGARTLALAALGLAVVALGVAAFKKRS